MENEVDVLEIVKRFGRAIKYIKNPSEEVQLAAVKKNGSAIRFIKNPSEVVLSFVKGTDGGN